MKVDKTSLKKRNIIARVNRNMFVWVAIVSAILGVSVVGSTILVQRIMFMQRVIDAKNKTLSTLEANNKAIPKLEDNVRALNSNQALMDSRAKETDEPLQVILDALPSEANSLALGASLQNVLLTGVSGITVESITVNPVTGVESLSMSGTKTISSSSTSVPTISFRFSIRGQIASLVEVLQRMEKSIRVIDTKMVKIESQGSAQVLTVDGVAYYQPARVVELKKTTVKQ